MLNNKRIEVLIKNMGELPTIPSVFFTVNKMLSDPRTSAIDVGQAVSNDPVIASKILKLANSAFYGFVGKVNTVSHAIAVLGFSATKNVVLTTSIISTLNLKTPIKGFNITDFWRHSAAVSAIARLAAIEFLPQKREEVFVSALLHDIGKLVLAICSPSDFVKCMNMAIDKNCLFLEAEQEILGINHTDIAALINEKWNLPPELAAVITNHHKNIVESGEHAKLVAVVKLADTLARGLQYGNPCDNNIPIIEDNVFEILNVTPQKLDNILASTNDALQTSLAFLNAE